MSIDLEFAPEPPAVPETCPDCGARSTHVRCRECGSHQLRGEVPCWKCKGWFWQALDAKGDIRDVTLTERPGDLPLLMADKPGTLGTLHPTKTTKKQRGPKPLT